MRPLTASIRELYDENGWLARTGAIKVWSSGEDSKRVSRTLNCWSCGREGSDESCGRSGMV